MKKILFLFSMLLITFNKVAYSMNNPKNQLLELKRIQEKKLKNVNILEIVALIIS